MGWFSKILGAGDALPKTVDAVGGALDSLFTSDDEKLTHAEIMERVKQEPAKWQALINLQEASHRSIFVAGWRPFIGWTCGLVLFYTYIFRDLIQWLLTIFSPETPPLPTIVTLENVTEIIFALLGLGTLRTFEKVRGASK